MTKNARGMGLRPILVLTALLTLGALAVIMLTDRQSAAAKPTGTLKLVVEYDRDPDARDDLAPAGDSPGDRVVYADPVFASDNRTRLGRAMFLNTFQQGGVLVNAALRLRAGTITLAGALVNGAGDLAVTGGTGAYAGARGTYKRGAIVAVLGEDGPIRERATITFTS